MRAIKSRATMRHSRPKGFKTSSSVTQLQSVTPLQHSVDVPLVYDRMPPFIGDKRSTRQSLLPYKPALPHTRMARSYEPVPLPPKPPPVTYASRVTQTDESVFASRVTQTDVPTLVTPSVVEPPPEPAVYDAPGVQPSVYMATPVAAPAPAPDEQNGTKKVLYVPVNPPRDYNLPSKYYTPVYHADSWRKAMDRAGEERRIREQKEAVENRARQAEEEAGAAFCRRCSRPLYCGRHCENERCALWGGLFVGYSEW